MTLHRLGSMWLALDARDRLIAVVVSVPEDQREPLIERAGAPVWKKAR